MTDSTLLQKYTQLHTDISAQIELASLNNAWKN